MESRIENIEPLDQEEIKKYRDHWDSLVHPTGSLGQIEEISIRAAATYGCIPTEPVAKEVICYSADNGIYDENISSSPEIFTVLLSEVMATDILGVNAMAKRVGGGVTVVDMGIRDYEGHPNILDRRLMNRTHNFMKEDAMGMDVTKKAIEVGMELAESLIDDGVKMIGIGELGMGNTTTAAVVISQLTGYPAEDVVGPGSGVDEEQFANKVHVVKEGPKLRNVDPDDPLDVLSKVGGLDIAAMVGTILACGSRKIPVVLDGIITIAAGIVAYKICPAVIDYIYPSHNPSEKGGRIGLEYMDMKGLFNFDMRLGEGAGTPLTFRMIEDGFFAMNNMTPFDETDMINVLVNLRDK